MNDTFLRAIADGSYWLTAHIIGAHEVDGVTSPSALAAEVLRLRGLVADLAWHEGELQRQAARAVEAERQRDEARAERDGERAHANEWLAQKHDAERERDEARRAAMRWEGNADVMERERDAAREEVRVVTAIVGEMRTVLGVPYLGDVLTHARSVMEDRHTMRDERDTARMDADQYRRERDAHAARNRGATQQIVEAIGSVGPESVEDAVPRVLAALAEARAETVRAFVDRNEARQSLRERTAEREALCERVSVLEERLRLSVAAWDAAGMQGRDAVSVIHEAQEQGARWAIEAWHRDELQTGPADEEAARICEARKAGEHG